MALKSVVSIPRKGQFTRPDSTVDFSKIVVSWPEDFMLFVDDSVGTENDFMMGPKWAHDINPELILSPADASWRLSNGNYRLWLLPKKV